MAHDPRVRVDYFAQIKLTREQALFGAAVRKLFWQANGRNGTDGEIVDWIAAQDSLPPVNPLDVLTQEEIAEVDAQLEMG